MYDCLGAYVSQTVVLRTQFLRTPSPNPSPCAELKYRFNVGDSLCPCQGEEHLQEDK